MLVIEGRIVAVVVEVGMAFVMMAGGVIVNVSFLFDFFKSSIVGVFLHSIFSKNEQIFSCSVKEHSGLE